MIFDVQRRSVERRLDSQAMRDSARLLEYEIGRLVRSGGRGGLPLASSVSVQFVPVPRRLGGSWIAAGTHILRVRGVLSSPVWRVVESAGEIDRGPSDRVILAIESRGVSGLGQDLSELTSRLDDETGVFEPAPVLVVDSRGAYDVLTLHGGTVDVVELDGADLLRLVVELTVPTEDPDGMPADPVRPEMSSRSSLSDVQRLGLLEEHWIYVRQPRQRSPWQERRLSSARVDPRTGVALSGGSGESWDLALEVRDVRFELQPLAGSVPGEVDEADTFADGLRLNADLLLVGLRARRSLPVRGEPVDFELARSLAADPLFRRHPRRVEQFWWTLR